MESVCPVSVLFLGFWRCDPLSRYTKGQYWAAKDCFRIYARTNEEYNDKYERMKAIADEKEYKE